MLLFFTVAQVFQQRRFKHHGSGIIVYHCCHYQDIVFFSQLFIIADGCNLEPNSLLMLSEILARNTPLLIYQYTFKPFTLFSVTAKSYLVEQILFKLQFLLHVICAKLGCVWNADCTLLYSSVELNVYICR